MKKNKGFTLVELLVVITIIALLLVIAIPNIMKMSNRMKERGLDSKIEAIEKAAVTYVQNNSNEIKKQSGICNSDNKSWCKSKTTDPNSREICCKCQEKKTGTYSREVCKYTFTMTVNELIDEKAYNPEDENSNACNVADPTNNEKCLDCATINIELDGDYKTVTATLDKSTISNDVTCP